MAQIIFKHPFAAAAFASSAEGMEEVARDDNEIARADALLRIIAACAEIQVGIGSVEIADADYDEARAVLEQALDNGSDAESDPNREYGLYDGDAEVVIGQSNAPTAREAFAAALIDSGFTAEDAESAHMVRRLGRTAFLVLSRDPESDDWCVARFWYEEKKMGDYEGRPLFECADRDRAIDYFCSALPSA